MQWSLNMVFTRGLRPQKSLNPRNVTTGYAKQWSLTLELSWRSRTQISCLWPEDIGFGSALAYRNFCASKCLDKNHISVSFNSESLSILLFQGKDGDWYQCSPWLAPTPSHGQHRNVGRSGWCLRDSKFSHNWKDRRLRFPGTCIKKYSMVAHRSEGTLTKTSCTRVTQKIFCYGRFWLEFRWRIFFLMLSTCWPGLR